MAAKPSIEWIMAMIESREPESTTLDFKRALPGAQQSERKDFLSDVVALANTRGGQIVYGIEEEDSYAARLSPIAGVAQEVARQRLSEMIYRGIEPPLRGVAIDAVEVDDGFVLVLTVDEQFGVGPFRTNYDGSQRFMYREGTQNFPMPYPLLRDSFGARASALHSLEVWRDERAIALLRMIEQKSMMKGPWVVLHALPVASFVDRVSVSPKEFKRHGFAFRDSPANSRFNLDGIRFTIGVDDVNAGRYVQFFRNGVGEFAMKVLMRSVDEESSRRVLNLTPLATAIRYMANALMSKLAQVGIAGEAHFCLSILDAEAWQTAEAGGYGLAENLANAIPASLVKIPPVVGDIPMDEAGFDALTRSILDVLWQVAGSDGCPHFDGDGRWIQPNR